MRERALVLLVAAIAALGSGGCAAPSRPRSNVLILTLDTTRADRLGCYGYAEAMTPHLDGFAADRAIRFDRAISPVPLTLPSHTTIMTGTFPVWHGIHDNDGFFLDEDVTTLAEILGQAGFATGAVIASFPLDAQFNLDQGFDTYNDNYQQDWTQAEIEARTTFSFGFLERRADQVNEAAYRWLDQHKNEPFFLWMHYFDPHQTYAPPPPYDSQAPSPYDGEIAFADENFGNLVAYMKQNDLLENTIIVVVGDHGEALGEHGEPTHATYVYDTTLRVPLLIAAPGEGIVGGGTVASQVRTADVAPTILDLLGLPIYPEMQGESLVPLLLDQSTTRSLPALAESHFAQYNFDWAPLRALSTDTWKYILAPHPELYNVADDPGERFNVATARPDVVAEMDQLLDELFFSYSSPDPARSTSTGFDPEVQARLAALGYLSEGSSGARTSPYPDREQLTTMHNPMSSPLVLSYVNLASEQLRLKRPGEAIDTARLGLAADPGNRTLKIHMARAQFVLGNYPDALALADEVAKADPTDVRAHVVMGMIYLDTDRAEQARTALEAAVQLEPNRVESLELLSRAEAGLGEFDDAAESLQKALEIDPDNPLVLVRLGSVLTEIDRWEEARAAFQEALQLDPYSPMLLDRIGILYIRSGNVDFSRQVFFKAVEIAPQDPLLRLHFAESLLRGDPDYGEARRQLDIILDTQAGTEWAEIARALLKAIPDGAPVS